MSSPPLAETRKRLQTQLQTHVRTQGVTSGQQASSGMAENPLPAHWGTLEDSSGHSAGGA
jgi:hypothetical protein